MQVLIKIPDEEYKKISNSNPSYADDFNLYYAIKNGTVLPKGHGRLKDVDAFLSKVKADREHSAYVRSWTADNVLDVLSNSYAPTIIEADKRNYENDDYYRGAQGEY